MKAPELPVDETARLLALQRTNLLDTPAEKRFDRITRLGKVRISHMAREHLLVTH